MKDRESPPESGRRELEDILAILSHDLRSPLSAISVGIDALADSSIDTETRDRYLAAMRRAVGRAERTLNDVLDVSRIAGGGFAVDAADRVSVAPLLERAAREHAAEAQATGNWIVVESEGPIPPVRADAGRLLQALDKMISNAMRHARGSGAITLRAENGHAQDRDTVRLWVIDRGPGIPDREREIMFDKWRRGAAARRTGAGLGLALAKGIAEAHGGSIHVETAPGDGARFCLELPAAA